MARKARSENGAANETVNDDLSRYADRLEQLELQRREIAASQNDVLQEASDKGFGRRPLKEIVKRRLETPEAQSKRQLYEEELDAMYRGAPCHPVFGMLAGTPLGQAAVEHLHFPGAS